MSRFRRYEIIEEEPLPLPLPFSHSSSSHFFITETLPFPSFIEQSLPFDLDLCLLEAPFHADLVRVDRTPSFFYKRLEKQQQLGLQTLSDRVAELESRFEQIVTGKNKNKKKEEEKKKKKSGSGGGDRKYTWTAEIKDGEKNGFDRKYKWIAELVEEEKKKNKVKSAVLKNVKWTAEIKGKGEDSGNSRKYTFAVESDDDVEKKKKKNHEKEKENENEKKKERKLRIVEIEEPNDHKVVVLRQAFAKRFGAIQNQRGKKKELSPQDAALLIQITFRAYVIRRSKALRALRELAIAKSKLKEIRAQFNNFSYRRRIASDGVERQRFSEKIIVLLLTVDAIEGVDLMVRSAKKSMVDELEAMLDVVDPQPAGRSLSFKRRTFDMPDGVIRKEIEEGVAQVVQMLDEAENSSSTFEG
ncbi:BAG family molecular chaperone regulator 7 [Trifolium pratense]|uniref:BAG family molecular chaperone regulator 7 n=1 Tax=Trifolium pratense TaxID=57577 RepID=UPI001E690171|nr:BAG family molecular chaperone regulator 7 [Trifolium pratense]